MVDDDGYPIDDELAWIRDFKLELGNAGEWFDFIHSCWWAASWGWHEEIVEEDGKLVRKLDISTGGWSGNEDIIEAMQNNSMMWMHTWWSSRRGGHYVFKIREVKRT